MSWLTNIVSWFTKKTDTEIGQLQKDEEFHPFKTNISVPGDIGQRKLEKVAKLDAAEGDGSPGLNSSSISQQEQKIVEQAQQYLKNAASNMCKKDEQIYPLFTLARADYLEALEQYESMKKAEGGRPINIQMSPAVYWPLVLLMSVCEVFVNFKAFETLFSSETSATALMASVVLAIILVFAAHSIGGAVQQRKNLGWAVLLGLLMIGITFGLAYLRLAYIGFENNADTGHMEMPKLNADMVTGFFVLFNLLFLTLAAWMAAKLHDKTESYEQRYKAYLRARAKLAKIMQLRNGNQSEQLREANDILGYHRAKIISYREINMQNRKIKATPRVWIENPPQALIIMNKQDFALRDNISGLEEDYKTQ
jgi:hypothetical protein